MSTVTVKSSEDRFIISIDKKSINKDLLLQFIDNLRLESLADKVDFNEEIEELGEEIKEDWWKKNKEKKFFKINSSDQYRRTYAIIM